MSRLKENDAGRRHAAANENRGSRHATLTSAQRRKLRAAAHHLKPVVALGSAGLSAAVMAEIERALEAHELIKIKLAEGDRATRRRLAARICSARNAELVQLLGRIAVVYRQSPEL